MWKSAFFLVGILFSSLVGAAPNVVVFLADDQGWGDLSYHGNVNLNTPRIDSLAEEGVSFDRFFVCPVCAPTRAEYLTGRYHLRTGVSGVSEGFERLNPDEQTIGDVFKAAGYATALYGKWHNGTQYPYHPNARGFDEFYGFCSGHWGNYYDAMLERNGEMVKGRGFLTDDITGEAIRFIRSMRDSEQPFFVTMAFNTPHSPMQVPDGFWTRFEGKEIYMSHRYQHNEKLDHTRAALAMVENIDWNVGRILDTLEELQIEEETIVVYFSDNGPNGSRWNGEMKGRKGSLDEGGVRSPLFIRWKGSLDEGAEMSRISSVTDLLPTLASFCGIALQSPKPLDGQDLSQMIKSREAQGGERYIFSHHRGGVSLRSQRYRLDKEGKLFDLINDPEQRMDLSGRKPEELRKMRNEMYSIYDDVISGTSRKRRPFTIAHPDAEWTQLPARDAVATGAIQRSNRYPNCSYFLNWMNVNDQVSWDVDALSNGRYEAIVYYTCSQKDLGATLELSFLEATTAAKVTVSHDPPLIGAEHDRFERAESYVKDWGSMSLGEITIAEGRGPLALRATSIPGAQAIEFRLLMLRKISGF